MNRTSKTIGIIGGGISGLACATQLSAKGANCIVFDKGRGPGGRMATRRADVAGATLRFDHGAQFFTARDARFIEQVNRWSAAGVAEQWPAAGDDAWVGSHSMNAPLRHLAEALDVRWGVRVEGLERSANGWRIVAGDQSVEVDQVVCALPAEQVAVLLQETAPAIAAKAHAVRSKPCWAAMLAFDAPLAITADCLNEPSAAIGWAARNSAKPGRSGGETWVVHARSEWTGEHLEEPKESVAASLAMELFAATGVTGAHPIHADAHRWLYAMPDVENVCDFVWDKDAGLSACGDWLLAPRVESAWLSGHLLGDAMTR